VNSIETSVLNELMIGNTTVAKIVQVSNYEPEIVRAALSRLSKKRYAKSDGNDQWHITQSGEYFCLRQ
jgi:predicted transcriptional regulator